MLTKIVDTDRIEEAALCLKNGGTVVFPTETVYGLGADCFNKEAVNKIYLAKGRPSDNPLIVHISKVSDLDKLVRETDERARILIEAFWPGPLTLIFKKLPNVPYNLTGGLDTIAVRFPSDVVARDLIEKSGVLVAAPSANLSGSPSPTKCEDVVADLDGRVDYIINSSPCVIGLESTVLDISGEETVILRPGAITLEMIKKIIPEARLDGGLISRDETPKCPGLKYKHYSPKAKVIVIQGTTDKIYQFLINESKKDCKLGILTYKDDLKINGCSVIHAGDDMDSYAHNLFSALREFDRQGVDIIYAVFKVEDGMGIAVRNRLYKAANHDIIEV